MQPDARELSIEADSAAELRVDDLLKSSSIEVLQLAGSSLSHECVKDLADILQKHPTITELRMRPKRFDDEDDWCIFAAALSGPRRLVALELRDQDHPEEVTSSLLNKLRTNKGLQALKLDRTHFEAELVLNFLRNHRDLQLLNYRELSLNEEAKAEVEHLLQRNRELARPESMQQLKSGIEAFFQATTGRHDIADPFWDLLTMELPDLPGRRVFRSFESRQIALAMRLTKSERSV